MSVSDSTYRTTLGDGTSVLERVLLAIINAHTGADTEGRQWERLNAVMSALVGPTTAKERDLEKALLFIVRERQRDVCDVEMQAMCSEPSASRAQTRSVPTLARLAAVEILGCATPAEKVPAVHALCAMYQDRFGLHARDYDDVREALQSEAVQHICDELAEWGIATRA